MELTGLGHGFHRAVVRYGSMQQPNAPEAMATVLRKPKIPRLLEELTYDLGRESFIASSEGRMGAASERGVCFPPNLRGATDAPIRRVHVSVMSAG